MTSSMALLILVTLAWLGLVGFVAIAGFPAPGWRRVAYAVLLPVELVLVGLRFAALAGPEEWESGNEIQLAMMVTFTALTFVGNPAMQARRARRAERRLARDAAPT